MQRICHAAAVENRRNQTQNFSHPIKISSNGWCRTAVGCVEPISATANTHTHTHTEVQSLIEPLFVLLWTYCGMVLHFRWTVVRRCTRNGLALGCECLSLLLLFVESLMAEL